MILRFAVKFLFGIGKVIMTFKNKIAFFLDDRSLNHNRYDSLNIQKCNPQFCHL